VKVFVLGGYGKTGFPAIKLLAQSDLVTEIAIVGRSLDRAEKAAKKIGKKAKAVQVDGADEEQLASLAAGYDIIVNAASNEVALPALHAAIRTGAHYCDVGWGRDFIAQMQELATEARDAGITAIICTGISTCITNLMGVYVANQLEEIEQLQIGRADIFNFQSGRELTPGQWLKDPKESLTALHEFRPFIAWMLERLHENGSRNVRAYHDGQWVAMDPIISGLDVPLAQDGTTISYPYFSGDDHWGQLPRDLSKVSPVEMAFSSLPPQLHDVLREHALRVLGGEIDSETATDSFYDTVESDPQRWLTLPDDFVQIPKMWVRAVGRKEGRAARHSCWFTPAMWNVGGYFLTSVALAVAVLRILRADNQERGVMTAEKTFEPLPFIDEVASLLPEPPPDGKLIGESFEWLE
jgi:saccharopine dehydrogenase-like NADP-dependent oxidoreductase